MDTYGSTKNKIQLINTDLTVAQHLKKNIKNQNNFRYIFEKKIVDLFIYRYSLADQ